MKPVLRPLTVFALALTGVIGLASQAKAGLVTVTFSGTINSASDNTGQNILGDAGILAGSSTFTGTLTYDSDQTTVFSGTNFAYYPFVIPTLAVTIDGSLTFQNHPSSINLRNDTGVPFYDEFATQDGSYSFPTTYNPSDSFMRFTLRDTDHTVFGPSPTLPTSLDLADFEVSQIFIRSDLDLSTGKTWTITGQIDSLSTTSSVNAVPEPGSLALLGMAGASFAGYFGWRRKQQANA